MIFRYFMPSSITAGSPVKTESSCRGTVRPRTKKSRPAAVANFMPTEMIFRISAVRFAPQYCDASTTMPIPMPAATCCRMNCSWLTSVAPERASSVYRPSIRLSTMFTISAANCCRAITISRLKKVL